MGTFPPSLHKLLLSTNIPRIAEKREFSGQAPTFFLFSLSLSLIFTRKLLGRQVRVGVVQSCTTLVAYSSQRSVSMQTQKISFFFRRTSSNYKTSPEQLFLVENTRAHLFLAGECK